MQVIACFILLLFLLYPPNFFDIPTFHIHLVLFIMAIYLLFRPNLIVLASTSNLHSHILKLCQFIFYLTTFSPWYLYPHFSYVVILYYTIFLWIRISYGLVSKWDIFWIWFRILCLACKYSLTTIMICLLLYY